MSESEPIERLSVSGASGMGKSTLVKALLIRRGVRRRLIFDPMDEYAVSAEDAAYDPRELYEKVSALEEYAEFSLRYCPPLPESAEDAEELRRFEAFEAGRLAEWSHFLGDNVLVIDEAHDACGRYVDARTVRHLKRGRHSAVYAWVISQRPADVSPVIRAELNAHEGWYLRLAEHRDLEVLQARRGKDFANRCMTLEKLHALRVLPTEQEPEEWVVAPGAWKVEQI